MDTTAILCSDLPRSTLMPSGLSELSGQRTVASLPFACRYRLIDFSLSACVNAGISKIGLASSFSDRELLEHVGSGKDWDLALRSGGVRFLPTNGQGHTRLDLLQRIRWAIAGEHEPNVLICDGDLVGNPDLTAMMEQHRSSGADLTVAVHPSYLSGSAHPVRSRVICSVDETGNVTDLYRDTGISGIFGQQQVCMHLYLFRRSILLQLLDEAAAHSLNGLHRLVVARCIGRFRVKAFVSTGFWAKIGSLSDYFALSMQVAQDEQVRKALFEDPNRPIMTRVRNSPPTLYRHHAGVRCSLIADGCEIEGEVENSILFRGVKVGRGASVRNSILLRGCEVSSCSSLKCVVADSGSMVRGSLSGAPSSPFYIGEGVKL